MRAIDSDEQVDGNFAVNRAKQYIDLLKLSDNAYSHIKIKMLPLNLETFSLKELLSKIQSRNTALEDYINYAIPMMLDNSENSEYLQATLSLTEEEANTVTQVLSRHLLAHLQSGKLFEQIYFLTSRYLNSTSLAINMPYLKKNKR